MAGAIGEAEVNQLGCGQASLLVEAIRHFVHTDTPIRFQHLDQSLATSSDPSLKLVHTCIDNHVVRTPTRARAPETSGQEAPMFSPSNISRDTFVNEIHFDADQPAIRDLTEAYLCKRSSMISTAYIPGTPPELTDSRSSKSSSCGSDFSTEHDPPLEIADINFEDIGLEDDHDKSKYGQSQRRQKQVKIGYTTRRPALQSIQQQPRVRLADKVSDTTTSPPIRRSFTSPNISVNTQVASVGPSSPPRRLPRSVSSQSIDLGGSAHSSSPRSSLAPSRRGSWQPQRKTIKELEAEYHDSDDELPEDANLWNVPISPSHSANPSPRSSLRVSPEQELQLQSLQPVPLEHVHSAPEPSPRSKSFSQPIPRHKFPPRSSSANPSRSSPILPKVPAHLRNNRAKSWNLAMSELSPEARVISENLEFHSSTTKVEEAVSGKLESGELNRKSDPSSIKLPPIQKGTLDFMPISKEKEAVLSRTRPSWLPPKDPKEEQRHLKEYQRMMAASIEAERKKEINLKSIQTQRDSIQASLNRIWDYYIEPTTDVTAVDRRVHDLCWRGIPSRVRGKVWQRALGNPLGLTPKTYEKALERAQIIKAKSIDDQSQLEKKISLWFTDIDRDAETAFPELALFQRNGPLWQDLVNLCQAYVCYRGDTGYHYGLQLIAALILVQISNPSDAFVFMANCLNKPITMAFISGDIASIQRTYNRVISNLAVKFPRLHDYLFESIERGGLGLAGHEVFDPMFQTSFSNGMDLDRLSRIWDIWVFEGDRTLIRTAVAVLGCLQSQIFNVGGDVHLKRRNVQEMLGWGPFNRSGKGSYWKLDSVGGQEAFIDEVDAVGKLDYTGR